MNFPTFWGTDWEVGVPIYLLNILLLFKRLIVQSSIVRDWIRTFTL